MEQLRRILAVLRQLGGRKAIRSCPGGTLLLSRKLPLTVMRYQNGVVRLFLNRLLPEGGGRRALAEEFSQGGVA